MFVFIVQITKSYHDEVWKAPLFLTFSSKDVLGADCVKVSAMVINNIKMYRKLG